MTTDATTPVRYAMGTLTTVFSFVVILCSLIVVRVLAARQAS
jgi:putative spermidine/putrescine transport system permease protein